MAAKPKIKGFKSFDEKILKTKPTPIKGLKSFDEKTLKYKTLTTDKKPVKKK